MADKDFITQTMLFAAAVGLDINALRKLSHSHPHQSILDSIVNKDISQWINDSGYLQSNDLDGFIYDVQYNQVNHILTLYRQNLPNYVIDFDLERLIMNIDLVGNDLIFTFEDGSKKTIPLNTLLVGVVKSVNGLTPNSQGEIVLNITDIPGLLSELNNKVNLSGNNATGALATTIANSHTHANKTVLDGINATLIANWNDASSKAHTHANKALLDTYNQTNANISDAVSLRHSHANKSILDATEEAFTTALKNKLISLQNYVLPVASATVLGGVRVGSNLNIDANGKLNAIDTIYTGSNGINVVGTIINPIYGTTANTVAQGNHVHSFASITNKPTTLLGYGITDAYTKIESDNKFALITQIPTVGNGALSIGVPTGLNVSGSFSANQPGNSAFNIVYSSGYQGYTSAEATKLQNIAPNANNYVHPNSGIVAGTYNKVAYNAQGHAVSGTLEPYLTSFTETDPTVPTWVKSITQANITSWNSKQNALINGLSTVVNGNKIDIAFENNAWITSKEGKERVLYQTTGASNNDTFYRLGRVGGEYNWQDSVGVQLMNLASGGVLRIKNLEGAVNNNQLVLADASGALFRSTLKPEDIATMTWANGRFSLLGHTHDWSEITGKPTIPTSADYITSNTNQTGLSGNKTTSGAWNYSSTNATRIISERLGSDTNNSMLFRNGSGNTIYIGQGSSNLFVIAGTNVLNTVANRWMWVDSSGLVSSQNGFSKTGATDADVLLGSGGHRPVSDFALASDYVSNTVFQQGNQFGTRTLTVKNGIETNSSFLGNAVIDTRSTANPLGSNGTPQYIPNPNSIPASTMFSLFHYGWGGPTWGSSIIVKGWNNNYKAWMISGDANVGDGERDFYFRDSNGTADTWNPSRMIWTDKHFTLANINSWNTMASGSYLPLAGGTMNTNAVINWAGGTANIQFASVDKLRLTATQTILASNQTGTGIGIYLRPQGIASANGQVTIQADSQINTSNHGNSSEWKQAYDWGDFRDYNLGKTVSAPNIQDFSSIDADFETRIQGVTGTFFGIGATARPQGLLSKGGVNTRWSYLGTTDSGVIRIYATNSSNSNTFVEVIHTGNLDSQATLLGFIKSSSIPAQVNLIQGAGIGITGTYPNLTITNTAPNIFQTLSQSGQVVTLSDGGGSFTLPTNNTYSGSTSILLATGNSFQRAALTGDVTAPQNSNVTTLAASGVVAGVYNNVASQIRPWTVDAKGRQTSIGVAIPIVIPISQVTNLQANLNTINNQITTIAEGVDFIPVTTATSNIKINKKKTIVTVLAPLSSATLNVDDGVYEGYELAVNSSVECNINIKGNVVNRQLIQNDINIVKSTLFWWNGNRWIESI